MRAFVVTGRGQAALREVPEPDAAPGEVIGDVWRAGVCGADVDFYTGGKRLEARRRWRERMGVEPTARRRAPRHWC